MLYQIIDDQLQPVRWVILTVNGRLRRRSNPSLEDCQSAGVAAYEYQPTHAPTYAPETQTISHSYAVIDGSITDVWTVTEVVNGQD